MMLLPDNLSRNRVGFALQVEPSFKFLNESSRPDFTCVRNLIEQWFADYPDVGTDKLDLRRRFRSKADRGHHAAFFELYAHALIRATGFDLQVHPAVDSILLTRPDFLALKLPADILSKSTPLANFTSEPAPAFYLECRIDSERSVETRARTRREQVIDAINKLQSDNFFLGVAVE